MKPTIISIVIAAALAAPLSAFAQASARELRCNASANDSLLRRTLPIDVLDHLERMQSSAFAHAFLLRFIADDSAGNHPVSTCARAFVGAPLRDISKLRQNLPDVPAILAALRTAEQARLQAQRMADSAPTLGRLLRDLRSDTTTATLHSHRAQLAVSGEECARLGAGVCDALRETVTAIDAAILRRAERDRAAEAVRQATAEADGAAARHRTERDALAADSAELRRLEADTAATDSARAEETEAVNTRIDSANVRVKDALEQRRLADSTALARTATWRSASEVADVADARMREIVGRPEFRSPAVSDRTVTAVEGARLGAGLEPVSTPPVEKSGTPPPVRSANVMLELTDFIIARARSELVNGFVVTLHGWAQKEELMRVGFPDTWGLMSGLAVRRDGTLDAVEVGRIPLTTWRATLAGDFVSLPVHLLEAEPRRLCQGADSARAATADRFTCAQRVALLRPLAPLAERLLEGDAVFDVLRDAGSLTPPSEGGMGDSWLRISQGLTVVSRLAETYRVQGHAPAANPARHPYILTAASFGQVPQRQRDALLRLLLVHAVAGVDTIPSGLDETGFREAAAGLVQTLDRLASRRSDADLRAVDAALLVRGTFDALTDATTFAVQFAPDSLRAGIVAAERRWTAVSSVIEPIVARDFGLAMARTTVLLGDWRGGRVPPRMLTLLSLATALGEARDGDQVRRAFEAAAAPVGGWQAKRYGELRLSVTALPGMAFGFESVIDEGGDPAGIGDWTPAFGASLPIGIEWQPDWMRNGSMDTGKCIVCGMGFFVPLIDLGALLSYRLDGDGDVASEPNASVRQVFAPGAFFSVSLTRRAPLTLIAGAQLLPSLRKVDVAVNAEPENRSAWRIVAGLGVDVHLFGF